MKAQIYGLITSISIHAVIISILMAVTFHGRGNELKTFYIQFTQRGEHTVQSPSAVRKIKKHRVTEPSRKEIREEIPATKNPPVREYETVIRTDAIESHEAVNVASISEPEYQAARYQGKEGTVSNASYSDSVIETKFGAGGAPAFLKREMPVYPIMARKLGKQGKVVLRLLINEKGRLLNVEVVEPAGYGFTESALNAVKMSTFIPAHENGAGIVSKALLSIRFVLK